MFNLRSLFRKKPQIIPPESLIVSEGRGGTFRYHISTINHPNLGLCGAKTMHTAIPLNAWGTKDHLPSRWCPACEAVAKEME
jgi:hypothetical protein